MAVMYAEDQKLGRAERMLADFETPSARDVEKVRGQSCASLAPSERCNGPP